MKQLIKFAAAVVMSIVGSIAAAQTVQTTPNLIQPNHWAGVTYGVHPGDCCTGGPQPLYDTSNNSINFSYGNYNVAQLVALNQALSGTGINVRGFNYSWTITTATQNGVDPLNASVGLYSSSGNYLEGFNYSYNNAVTNQTYSGTENFSQHYPLASLYGIQLNFQSVDNGFWAGYYGPRVSNISLTANYGVDPCAANPAYSPSCPGFNTVITSGNLLSGTTGVQAYAINQALALAGAGATIHGFDYGYNYNVAGRQCAVWDLFGLCLTGFNYSDAGVSTVITDSNNATIFSESNTHNGGDNGTSGTFSKQFRFGSSLPMSTLGGFAMAPWTSGNASITNMYSNAVYTPDVCISNPLYSPSCPGYAAAYFTQQCTANPLYDSSCPGYAQAFFTQQCTANQLYNPACPGYAAAYLNQQCTANPLYATQCPGYETAYLNQQCTANPLYSTSCSGYQTATTQCSVNPLSNTLCSGYTTASNTCSNNQLTYSYCPNYTTTLASCGSNPQSNTMCPGYSTTKSTSTGGGGFSTSSTSEPSLSVSSSGKVEATVSKTGDSNVDSVVDRQSTSASPSDTTAAVKLAPAPAPPSQGSNPSAGPAAPMAAAAAKEEKKKDEQKAETSSGGQGPMAKSSGPSDGGDKDRPKTARQEIQEKREAAAKAKAVEEGKQLAGKMGDSVSMEQQIAVQNVVLQAMGFTPGFDVYNRAIMPDAVGYRTFEIYRGQRNIDTPSSRRLLSGSDRLHTEMIDQQYNRGQ